MDALGVATRGHAPFSAIGVATWGYFAQPPFVVLPEPAINRGHITAFDLIGHHAARDRLGTAAAIDLLGAQGVVMINA